MEKNRRLHLLGLMFDGIASGMMLMALPWFILKQGSNGTFLAVVTLVCTIMSFVLTPLIATAIDRYPRKRILALTQLIQLLAGSSVVIAGTVISRSHLGNDHSVSSVWVLAFCLVAFWIASDLAWATNGAFTQELYVPSEYGRISSQQEIVMQITTLSAGGMGVWLLELWSLEKFALLAASLSLVALMCFVAIRHRSFSSKQKRTPYHLQLRESTSIFRQSPRFFAFIALSCVGYPMMTYLAKLVPIYLSENQQSGEWFAWWQINYGVGAMVCGLMIVKVMNKVSHQQLMLVSMASISVLLCVMTMTLSPLSIVLVALLIGVFNATNRIARVNKLHHEVDNSVRGRVDGGMKLFSTALQSASYVVIAYLANYQLTELGFAIGALVIMLATFAMWLLRRTIIVSTSQPRFIKPAS
ncbi:MFS transporter [Vibrio sp. CB1-14]|uniref:MFS transporter n=1 Tax=Vibrio chaetopteri TaxID=3016528 RepID=A0AAU8BSF3_9VIBR